MRLSEGRDGSFVSFLAFVYRWAIDGLFEIPPGDVC